MLTASTTPHDLASMLGTSYAKMCYTLYKKGTSSFYTTFFINKKKGGLRKITAPDGALSILQMRLKPLLEKLYIPHPAASAFIAQRGIIYNAKPHIKKGLVFNIDLSNFYDHIHFGRIYGLLISKPYSLQKKTAEIIAHICCYKTILPQGAPTSPVISNMICRSLDKELSHFAKQSRGFYTRYADDMTFSFIKPTKNKICELEENDWKPKKELVEIIKRNGFTINNKKTRGEKFDSRQTVTGLKVNKIVNLDRRYIRTTRAMIHSLSKDVELANSIFKTKNPHKKDCKFENVVAGRINFIGMVKGIESSVYQTLAIKYNNLNTGTEVPLRPVSKNMNHHDEIDKNKAIYKQNRLNKCLWVITFEGISGLCMNQQLVQGTAFMVNGQTIYTCDHTFSKAGNPTQCYLHRITSPETKILANVKSRCNIKDLAKLELVNNSKAIYESLTIYNKEDIYSGYRVNLAGFPQLLSGHKNAAISPATVIGHFTKSTIDHYEVNTEIMAGFSGGPVLNKYDQVIGMVVMGKTVTVDSGSDEAVIEGTNAFISAKHF